MNTDPVYLALGIREYLYADTPCSSLIPLFSGHQCCSPGHLYQGIREHYLLCCVSSGHGTFSVYSPWGPDAAETHRMGPGDTFLIRPGQLTRYIADELQPWTYSWIAFSGSAAESCLSHTPFSRSQMVHTGTELYEQLFQLTENSIRLDQPQSCAMHAAGLLWKLFGDLSMCPEKAAPTPRRYVDAAISIIRRGYDSPLSVSDMAFRLGISREYLYTIFREATGKSPLQYLLDYRIEQACQLLRHSSYPIYLIAQHTGFQDNAYFSRQFRRVTGLSASEYRRRNTVREVLQPNDQEGEIL